MKDILDYKELEVDLGDGWSIDKLLWPDQSGIITVRLEGDPIRAFGFRGEEMADKAWSELLEWHGNNK